MNFLLGPGLFSGAMYKLTWLLLECEFRDPKKTPKTDVGCGMGGGLRGLCWRMEDDSFCKWPFCKSKLLIVVAQMYQSYQWKPNIGQAENEQGRVLTTALNMFLVYDPLKWGILSSTKTETTKGYFSREENITCLIFVARLQIIQNLPA